MVINKSQNNKEFDYLESIFVISFFNFLFLTVLTKWKYYTMPVVSTVMHTTAHKGYRKDAGPGRLYLLYFNTMMIVPVLLTFQSVLANETSSLNTGILCLITNKIAGEKGLALTGIFSKMKHTEPVFLSHLQAGRLAMCYRF